MKNLTKQNFGSRMRIMAVLMLSFIAFIAITCIFQSAEAGSASSIAMAGMFGSRERAVFNTVKKAFPNGIPSPSFLRIEQGLNNSKNLYSFDIKKNGNEQIQEVKLDRNDVFVAHSLAVFISAQNSTTVGKEVLQTYPNKVAFGTTTGFNYKDLEAVYNGWLRLKIGAKVNIENLPLLHFRKIPQTQEIAAVTYGSSATQSGSQAIDNSVFDLMNFSYPLESLLYLHGTMDIKFEIEYPIWSGIQVANTASNVTNKIVLYPIGLLVKGEARANR